MKRKTLDRVKKGELCVIRYIPAGDMKTQAIRFNMVEGNTALCQAVIPAGPIILKVGRQEIALGRHLAQQIEVEEPDNETVQLKASS